MASNFNGSISELLIAAKTNTVKAYSTVKNINNGTIAAVQFAVKESNVQAYKVVYLVAIAFGVVAIAASISVKSVDAKKRSNERAARLENEKHVAS